VETAIFNAYQNLKIISQIKSNIVLLFEEFGAHGLLHVTLQLAGPDDHAVVTADYWQVCIAQWRSP
jgi:hypothetical protein